MRQGTNPRSEIAAIRGLLAGAALDVKMLRLERALRHKFSPDQPRAPAGQPNGGRWIPADGAGSDDADTSHGTEGDVASRSQTLLDDGTRVLTLRIRSGQREYDRQDIVTAPDGQSRIFETSGLTQTIRDGATGAVLGRSTFTADGAEPEAFAQPAFAPAVPLGVATVELALWLFSVLSSRNSLYSRTVLGLSAHEFKPDPEGGGKPVVWVGPITRDKLDKACRRNAQVEEMTNRVARRVHATGLYTSPQAFGNKVHYEIAKEVKSLKDPDFKAEISLDRSSIEILYGTEGSVRLDLLERGSRGTTCIYDYKTGNAQLDFKRAVKPALVAKAYFPGTLRFIVIQVKPRL
ncbi:PD-(D/E)XK endonuclease-like domain-containing protein [Methylorubrum populi]